MSTTQEISNKTAFREFCDAMNTGDAELISRTIDEMVEPDAVIRTPLPLQATGPEKLKEVFARLHCAFPDLRIMVEDVIAEGDKVVGRNVVTGTHRGAYMGLPPSGRSVTYDEIFVFRFANGRIAETWGVVDVFSQMQQLGLLPVGARNGKPPLFSGGVRGSWQLDPERSSVEFRVGHFWGLGTVKGQFEDYHGRLDLSASPAIQLTINAASVQTGNRRRDRHLRSSDFLDVENHPQVQFLSEAVDLEGDTLKVDGRLSARGRSIPMNLDAQLRQVGEDLELQAVTTASHRELGMTWSPLRMIAPRGQLLVKAHLVPLVR
jgi:steroid delta-isomerase-like uncharacterized protein